MSLRCFVALPLSDALRAEAQRLQRGLRKGLAFAPADAVSWVRPGSVHLTLAFLGEVDEARLPGLVRALSPASEGCGRLLLQPAGLGLFPHERRPRVLWVGVEDRSTPRLAELQTLVAAALEAEGFPPERRPFSPHLTLARIRLPIDPIRLAGALAAAAPTRFEPEPVARLALYRSELLPQGAHHTELASLPLG